MADIHPILTRFAKLITWCLELFCVDYWSASTNVSSFNYCITHSELLPLHKTTVISFGSNLLLNYWLVKDFDSKSAKNITLSVAWLWFPWTKVMSRNGFDSKWASVPQENAPIRQSSPFKTGQPLWVVPYMIRCLAMQITPFRFGSTAMMKRLRTASSPFMCDEGGTLPQQPEMRDRASIDRPAASLDPGSLGPLLPISNVAKTPSKPVSLILAYLLDKTELLLISLASIRNISDCEPSRISIRNLQGR